MGSKSAELLEEQGYFDHAHRNRERRRAALGDVASAAAHPGAAKRLLSWVKAKREAARSPQEAVAFGRIDDQSERALYIGHEMIADEDHEILVVNWQAPAAARYYEATHADPHGLARRRAFVCSGNHITDFDDVVFQQLARDVAALEALDGPDALLLSELDRPRDGTMRDIVATIQAAQYELIRAPLDQVLVIEGGPGTGKTAVALHRVSWLLFNHRDRLTTADVLVVGPHPTFTRYIRTVLPDLGDRDVEQRDIGQLAPQVRGGRPEPTQVQRLKGDVRMAGLLARALEARVGAPEPAERMLFDGRFVTLSGTQVAAAVSACQQAGGPYAQRRSLLRERLRDLAYDRGTPAGERLEPVENLVERLWPQFSAPAFLRGLFGSLPRLTAAAGAEFTGEEIALLRRRGADRLSAEVWSSADLPLLDEAEDLINGTARRYRHIVVDEAQDLSPMQLRGVARRSATGSLTIVGDLAQSTGAWARDEWAEVLRHLPATLPHTIVPLRYGYRVPRRVYDLAARLLPVAAATVTPITVVRAGPADPVIHRVSTAGRAGRAVTVAMAHAAAGRFVGLVCPPTTRPDLEDALAVHAVTWNSTDRDLDALISVVGPQEAKGLEFDAVVVIEPEEIVASDERGHRVLFTALTRTTRYLDIVAVGDPLPLSQPASRLTPRPRDASEPDGMIDTDQLDQAAQYVAAFVTSGAPPALWHEVLQRAAAILDHQAPAPPTGRHRHD